MVCQLRCRLFAHARQLQAVSAARVPNATQAWLGHAHLHLPRQLGTAKQSPLTLTQHRLVSLLQMRCRHSSLSTRAASSWPAWHCKLKQLLNICSFSGADANAGVHPRARRAVLLRACGCDRAGPGHPRGSHFGCSGAACRVCSTTLKVPIPPPASLILLSSEAYSTAAAWLNHSACTGLLSCLTGGCLQSET